MNLQHYIKNKGHEKQISFISQIKTVPNAIIFSGLEGIGRKLVSQYYFAAINAFWEKARPSLMAGDLDQWRVYEPEPGKKTFSVDQVRGLLRDVQENPHPFRYRVVVLDRAECFTFEAASALLKVLEDPPYDWTRFVLLTTSADSLLPTIRSRAYLLQFYPLSINTVEQVLSEKQLDRAVELAKVSGGSVGRALELAVDQNRQIRASVISFIAAGSQIVLYSAFQFIDGLKAEDLLVVNKVLEMLVCDLVAAKLTGHVVYNRDFEVEIVRRVAQAPGAILTLIQDITEYLSYTERGLNIRLQLKNLMLSSLFLAKGLVLDEMK